METENEPSLYREPPGTHGKRWRAALCCFPDWEASESVSAEAEIDDIGRKSQTPHSICEMCKATLTASIYDAANSSDSLSRTSTYWHHKTYRHLSDAVERGCFICTLLWESIPDSSRVTLSALPEPSDGESLLTIDIYLYENKDTIENAVLCLATNIRECLNLPRQVQIIAQISLCELGKSARLF
jgi:hypothetical protein